MQTFQRYCPSHFGDDGPDVKYINDCVDVKTFVDEWDEFRRANGDPAAMTPDYDGEEPVFVKVEGGQVCFCDTGDNCNDDVLEAVGGSPPSYQPQLGLTALTILLTALARLQLF